MAQRNTIISCGSLVLAFILIVQVAQSQPPNLGSSASCGRWCQVFNTAGQLIHTYHHCKGTCGTCAGAGYKVFQKGGSQIAPGVTVASGIYIYRQCIYARKCSGFLFWRKCSG